MPRIQPKQNSNEPINIFKTMDVSSTFLNGFKQFHSTVSQSKLSSELKEKIALTAAGINDCDYCKAAHTGLATKEGISEKGIEFALKGQCGNPEINAALQFTTAIIEKKGHIDDADFKAIKDAGYSDEEIIDIFGQVMVNIITNYFNDFNQTEIDL